MAYAVKEIFHTLQGEGAQAGRPAVFLRFAGCNLWTGREADRATAVCRFCDTDFVGMNADGGSFSTAAALADAVAARWPGGAERRFVVCTGGEPLLQLDPPLIEALHARQFSVAVETNGTIAPPLGIDWLCVSPKADASLVIDTGDELKLIYPQDRGDPRRYAELDFRHFFLQPMDGPCLAAYTRQAIEYCMAHPQWRLSLQTHKLLGIR
jgi:7-carboxy-7-deazaguanine synthase (Cx14CxxC type)